MEKYTFSYYQNDSGHELRVKKRGGFWDVKWIINFDKTCDRLQSHLIVGTITLICFLASNKIIAGYF